MRRTSDELVFQTDARPDADGWLELQMRRGARVVERARVRLVRDAEGRHEVRELHLLDVGKPITPERLRAFRLGELGAMVDARAALDESGGRQPRRTRPLKPPTGGGYGDEFYEQVATSYRAANATGARARPVMTIAQEAG